MPDVVLPLTVRDLTAEDLLNLSWTGIELTDRSASVERARLGELDYLAVCPPSGVPVATGGARYTENPGAGTLWQLSVDTALQSCGIGTILIQALERRIRARGLSRAEIGAEESNPRARALYERLGYVAYGRKPESWDEEAQDGSITRYETMCTLLRKELP